MRSRKRSYESPESGESAAEQVGPRNLFLDFNANDNRDIRDEREGAVDQGEACEGGSCAEEGGSIEGIKGEIVTKEMKREAVTVKARVTRPRLRV